MSKIDTHSNPAPLNPARSANCPCCHKLPSFTVRWEIMDDGTARLRIDGLCDCGTVSLALSAPGARQGQLPMSDLASILDAWRGGLPRLHAEEAPTQTPTPAPNPVPTACNCGCKQPGPSVDERLDTLLDWYNDRLASLGAAQAKVDLRMEELAAIMYKSSQDLISNVDDMQEYLDDRLDRLEEQYASLVAPPRRAPQHCHDHGVTL